MRRYTHDHMIDIDWQRVVLNLRHAGLTYSRIAREIGVHRNTVQNCASGRVRDPARFGDCLALLDLHIDHCPDRHSLEVIGR